MSRPATDEEKRAVLYDKLDRIERLSRQAADFAWEIDAPNIALFVGKFAGDLRTYGVPNPVLRK